MKLINKFFWVVALSILVTELSVKPTYAQEDTQNTNVDLSKISCREVLKMPGEDKQFTFVFFHGLITGKNKQMTIDRIALREASDKITDYCIENPKASLMSGFEKYR
ncbi:HdeA/HdeB family chaperone [Aphanothece sacrum]|uniref:Hns-dependent expression protein A n=1 Tax=Aphanothece sacrum FPU1 TaxID=1920663 RepID=A0A401IMJ5_APHSA|nr:HdeA/HdeB family chaperone [Aphanothece sacrum]GBF82477.1 Hns-dependent expression protein A [Aphanothece sacrum FPU1]GBF84368.1 Hns-dependent expression protein A [Aphanothece sacrum FPU3]